MKKLYRLIIIGLILTMATSANLLAQAPPPPPPGHGETGNQPGGNAPVGGGLFILIGLATDYGGKKLYNLRKDKLRD
jgi:hypothetical protein